MAISLRIEQKLLRALRGGAWVVGIVVPGCRSSVSCRVVPVCRARRCPRIASAAVLSYLRSRFGGLLAGVRAAALAVLGLWGGRRGAPAVASGFGRRSCRARGRPSTSRTATLQVVGIYAVAAATGPHWAPRQPARRKSRAVAFTAAAPGPFLHQMGRSGSRAITTSGSHWRASSSWVARHRFPLPSGRGRLRWSCRLVEGER